MASGGQKASAVRWVEVQCPTCRNVSIVEDGGSYAYVSDKNCTHPAKVLMEFRRIKDKDEYTDDYIARDDDDPYEPRRPQY